MAEKTTRQEIPNSLAVKAIHHSFKFFKFFENLKLRISTLNQEVVYASYPNHYMLYSRARIKPTRLQPIGGRL
jgi:hypothetical protein